LLGAVGLLAHQRVRAELALALGKVETQLSSREKWEIKAKYPA
jgi:hypothetical protein